MEKLKQHYMVNMERGEVHPLFLLKYLPENLASLAETIILFIEWLLGLVIVFGLLVKIFVSNPADSLLAYILNSMLTHLFSIFGVSNNLNNNIVAFVVFVAIYYLTRKYFEHIKYNLHMLRKSGDLEQIDKHNEV